MLKQQLKKRGSAFGTMVFEFFTPGLPAIVEATGADFIIFDMEHAGASFETLKIQIAACNGLKVAPIVRVPNGEYHFIARALDIGAHGVMVPMVETKEQAEHIVACAHYPPHGRRGAAFNVAHDGYTPGAPGGKMAAARKRTLVIPQIETPKGVENVDAIAGVSGVDIPFLGHFDLTNFMGIPAEFDHPDYRAALKAIVGACERHGKHAGTMAGDEAWARQYWKLGFRVFAYGLDIQLYQRALKSGIDALAAER